jgi:hypothetical protein
MQSILSVLIKGFEITESFNVSFRAQREKSFFNLDNRHLQVPAFHHRLHEGMWVRVE